MDADTVPVDLVAQTSLFIIVCLLAKFWILFGIGGKPLFQFGIVGIDFCNIVTLVKIYFCDFLLLCTDGLTGMVEDDVICNIVSNDRHSSRLDQVELDLRVRKLIDTANKNSGHDNITVVLVRI